MIETIHVVPFGLGPIGVAAARECLRRGHELVGAVDVDPARVGKDAGAVLGLEEELGIPVVASLREAVDPGDADAVLHCATSYAWEAHPQLAEAFLAGCHVVSTCEELSYPWRAHRHLAQEIDQAAKREKVTALATGVNPGFVMDVLPVVASSVCRDVARVHVRRTLDVGPRREALRRNAGVGLTVEAFEAKAREGELGHVGTYESVDLIGAAFAWNLSRVEVSLHPVVVSEEVRSGDLTVPAGRVAGIRQVGRGFRRDQEVILLELEMYASPPEPLDEVRIEGDPPLTLRVDGGIPGDAATVGAVVNALPRVLEAAPGLKTMLDLPLPSFVSPFLRKG